ncbi:MAG: RecQ family ATP-dependent DNA helicase [Gemmatimonadetes bacterium]|nr:RecQ family ATP-dependent DNA helicase [Gemmatimonadota bacterium]
MVGPGSSRRGSTPQPPAPTLAAARAALKRHFSYPDFRSAQASAIMAALTGRDALVVMPTGGGKSLCYQVPAVVLPGVTLVVSPLISLMKDQVDALADAGIAATFVNSSISGEEIRSRVSAAARGEIKLLYIAPERFDSPWFQQMIADLDVSLLAVDEAHCLSEWGHEFRPSYLRLGAVRASLTCPAMALTATATPQVRRDIVQHLRLRRPLQLVRGFDRPNLSWTVRAARTDAEKDGLLLRLLRDVNGVSIVYTATRKAVELVRRQLARTGVSVAGYHAGLSEVERERVQEGFMAGATRVIVATNAFGMGIDKPDVRLVVHYQMSGSLEAYYQEAGRAGRDGQPAHCVLLHRYADRFVHEFLVDQSFPDPETVGRVHRALRAAADERGFIQRPVYTLLEALPDVRNGGHAAAALRILETAGAMRRHPYGADGAAHVRLLALPERIREELTGRPEWEGELKLLRSLWRAAGKAEAYGGFQIPWSKLAATAGSTGRARKLLEGLARRSFLEWSPVPAGPEWQVLLAPGQERIDWEHQASRRQGQLEKLRRMQGYVYARRCRLAHILRYFGDAEVMRRCGRCDNCRGAAQPLLADVPAPGFRTALQSRLPGRSRRTLVICDSNRGPVRGRCRSRPSFRRKPESRVRLARALTWANSWGYRAAVNRLP